MRYAGEPRSPDGPGCDVGLRWRGRTRHHGQHGRLSRRQRRYGHRGRRRHSLRQGRNIWVQLREAIHVPDPALHQKGNGTAAGSTGDCGPRWGAERSDAARSARGAAIPRDHRLRQRAGAGVVVRLLQHRGRKRMLLAGLQVLGPRHGSWRPRTGSGVGSLAPSLAASSGGIAALRRHAKRPEAH